MVPTEVTIWGVAMMPLVLGIVMLLQQLGLSDYWADWVRALAVGGLIFLGAYQAEIAEAVPWLPDVFANAMLALGAILALKGAWPDLRGMWNRASGVSSPHAVALSSASLPNAKYADGKGRFF